MRMFLVIIAAVTGGPMDVHAQSAPKKASDIFTLCMPDEASCRFKRADPKLLGISDQDETACSFIAGALTVPPDSPQTAYQSCANNARAVALEKAKNITDDDETCRSYGLKYGTGDYAQCRLELGTKRQGAKDAELEQARRQLAEDRANDQRQQAEDARAAEGAEQQRRAAVIGMILRNNQPQQVWRPIGQPSSQVNCTTSHVGDQSYTHCQ